MLETENEFNLEFADDDVEKFTKVEDVVEHIARSFFASWNTLETNAFLNNSNNIFIILFN